MGNSKLVEEAFLQVNQESQDEILDLAEQGLYSLSAKLSAILFISNKPLSSQKLAESLAIEEDEILTALDSLKSIYSDQVNGFSLVEVNGGYQFRTSPELSGAIRQVFPKKSKKLTKAAAETLAVIAYKQPVQKAEIEAIRGVDALPTLKTLLDSNLIRIVGRDNAVGHPALYGTTDIFLERFGLNDLSELPSIRELNELEAEPGEVMEVEDHEEAFDDESETSEILS